MTEATSEPRPRRRRVPLWAKVAIAATATFAALIASPHIYFGLKTRAEMQRIKAAGEPVSLDELDALYPTPPPGQNAANAMLAAFDAFVDTYANSAEVPIAGTGRRPERGQPMTEATMRAVAKFVADNAAAIDMLRKATAIKESRYPISLSAGFSMINSKHLTKIRQATRILSIDALYLAQQHDTAGATDSLKAVFAVAHSVAKEPMLFSQWNRNMCNEISIDALSRALSIAEFSDKELAETAAALQAEEEGRDESVIRMWECARCSVLDAFRRPTSIGAMLGTPIQPGFSSLLYKGSGAMAADQQTYLMMARGIIAACREPYPQRLVAFKNAANAASISEIRLHSTMLARLYNDTYEREADVVALLRAARTGIAVERYRVAKGALPENLDALVPQFIDAVPSDPFDGKPLRFKKLKPGYVVYSVGPNLADDGGTERNPTATADSPSDVTFIVER